MITKKRNGRYYIGLGPEDYAGLRDALQNVKLGYRRSDNQIIGVLHAMDQQQKRDAA